MAGAKPFAIGIVIGVLVGTFVTALVTRKREVPHARQDSHFQGEVPEMAEGHGEGGGHGGDEGHGGEEGVEASFAKVHFMRKFVDALTEPPRNLMPKPDYAPLLKEGAEPIRCADCHADTTLNIEAMVANDPGDEAVERFRMMRRGFMIPLMEKWMARLNQRHAVRLRKEISCVDCHAIDPRDDEARFEVIPPLMVRFVKALRERPQNANPARSWRPLLKDPSGSSMLCSVCHASAGAAMERNIASFDRPPPAGLDRQFMINLMERWVRELNVNMKDQLVKAVGCIDCHEIDPRK
jgi:hypothetical protein